jgi:hypothetical protein
MTPQFTIANKKLTTRPLIVSTIGRTYRITNSRNQQTCVFDNYNYITGGPIFNMVFCWHFIIVLFMQVTNNFFWNNIWSFNWRWRTSRINWTTHAQTLSTNIQWTTCWWWWGRHIVILKMFGRWFTVHGMLSKRSNHLFLMHGWNKSILVYIHPYSHNLALRLICVFCGRFD